jgi:hypothetical protein
VNVTLVDIRAWDTMGEISVLVVAAIGVASLVFGGSRRFLRRVRRPPLPRLVTAGDGPAAVADIGLVAVMRASSDRATDQRSRNRFSPARGTTIVSGSAAQACGSTSAGSR